MAGQIGGARGGAVRVADFQHVGLHRIGQHVRQNLHAAGGHAVGLAAFDPVRPPRHGAVVVGEGPHVEPVEHRVRARAGKGDRRAVGDVGQAQRQDVLDVQARVGHRAGVDHRDRVGQVGAWLEPVGRAGLLRNRQSAGQHVGGRAGGPGAVGAADRRVVVDVAGEVQGQIRDDLGHVAHRGRLSQADGADVVAAFVEGEPRQLGRQAVRGRTARDEGAVGGVGGQVRRRNVLEHDVVGHGEADVDHVDEVFQRVARVRIAVAVHVVEQRGELLGQHGRIGRNGVAHVEVGRAGLGILRVLAPGAEHQRAVERVVAQAGLVFVGGVEERYRLQRRHVGGEIVAAAQGVGQRPRARVPVVVHVEGRVADGRHPDGTAVGAGRGRAVARAPPHHAHGGHHPHRHQPDAPVVGLARARRVEQIHPDERTAVGGGEPRAAVHRHPVVRAHAVRGDDQRAGARRRHGRHRDGVRVRVEQIDVRRGRAGAAARGHRREIVRIPLRFRPQLEPAHFVVRADVARDQRALERLRSAHRRPGPDPAVHEIGFALVQVDRLLEDAVVVRVDFDAREVVVGHEIKRRVAEHLVGVGPDARALPHRRAVFQPVRTDVVDADRFRQHFAGIHGVHRARDRDRLAHRYLVPAVVFDRQAVARDVDFAFQPDHVARRQHVARIARRIAVGRIRVAPRLAARLRRGREIRLVAVFPVVVVDQRAVGSHHDGHHRLHHVADGAPELIDGVHRDLHLVFRDGQEVRLQHVRRLRRQRSARPQRPNRRQGPLFDRMDVHVLENRSIPPVQTLHRQLAGG